ncbi:hypothetical protein [Priestia endophytica]|uniref:hypothetical protein n=1 Tax=Priestia endophytica TaxID=135735 RepID=UPI00227F9065|nr:hypothetical protein [Priestia endophytica]MCY8235110.1 hypothetical protein [Priestia endophytica]
MSNGAVQNTAPSLSFLNWLLHPIQTTKEHGVDAIYNMINPFLDIVLVMSQPIASIILTTAGFLFIVGMRDKCIKWMTTTSLVYVCIQLFPMLLKAILHSLVHY